MACRTGDFPATCCPPNAAVGEGVDVGSLEAGTREQFEKLDRELIPAAEPW